PFTSRHGMPLLLRHTSTLGHRSVSVRMKRFGFRFEMTRFTAQGKSRGMWKKWSTHRFSLLRAMACPVSVAVEKATSTEGFISFTAFTRGATDRTSPTERAWNQTLSRDF